MRAAVASATSTPRGPAEQQLARRATPRPAARTHGATTRLPSNTAASPDAAPARGATARAPSSTAASPKPRGSAEQQLAREQHRGQPGCRADPRSDSSCAEQSRGRPDAARAREATARAQPRAVRPARGSVGAAWSDGARAASRRRDRWSLREGQGRPPPAGDQTLAKFNGALESGPVHARWREGRDGVRGSGLTPGDRGRECAAGGKFTRPTGGDQIRPRRRLAAAVRLDHLTRVPLSRSRARPPAATIAPVINSAVAGL